MDSHNTVWLETLLPAGVVRADRLVRVFVRRGGNLDLVEPTCDDVTDVSFCAEIETSDRILLLGCTDEVDSADDQLGELIETLTRAARRSDPGPTFVVRGDGGAGRPRWTICSRLPGSS
ncbi:hypothetical protein [Pseudonocardia sp. ICBG1293]|uniref:hypothetical protein n=1 Tax=Pseudonocardia sp. ICBG1293 TaxID=2844382 RepID=UPI001CCBE045|nr:hypothetical protein [Pseudonocardia sp. ICBG1293]